LSFVEVEVKATASFTFGLVKVLFVKVSTPSNVANVPVVGRVSPVEPVVVNEIEFPAVPIGITPFAPKSGSVYTLLATGATEFIVVVLVVPKTNWLVAEPAVTVFVTLSEVPVAAPIFGVVNVGVFENTRFDAVFPVVPVDAFK
jgi:hypothetical protein